MNNKARGISVLVSAVTLVFAVSLAHAAKPAGKGGGSENTTASNGAVPEFYSTTFDYAGRMLTLNGIHFITDDAGTAVLPQVSIGGQTTTVDPASGICPDLGIGNECPVLIPFDNILDALAGPRAGTDIRVLPGEISYEIKVVALNPDSTPAGTARFTTYFPKQIKDLPVDTGTCPCAADFTALYNPGSALPGTRFCSETEGIPTGEYIEAGYAPDTESVVIIGSHSSSSQEPLYAGSCYVRDLTLVIDGEEVPQYLGSGPKDLTDNDHNNHCVPLIRSLEAGCVSP
jgi:hypothetical protein